MFLRVKQIVGASAAILLILAMFVDTSLEHTYVYYPRSPVPEQGRTVAHAAKGIVVYITEEQRRLVSWVRWVQLGSGIVAALVILIHRGDPGNPFRSRK